MDARRKRRDRRPFLPPRLRLYETRKTHRVQHLDVELSLTIADHATQLLIPAALERPHEHAPDLQQLVEILGAAVCTSPNVDAIVPHRLLDVHLIDVPVEKLNAAFA
jgi:hypothetical protein